MAAGTLGKTPFKPMRKGTKSCHECRRRKIKCLYEHEGSLVCQECSQHSRKCVKQGYVRDKALELRVARTQTAVDKLRNAKASTNTEESSSETESLFMQLFDNSILLRESTNKINAPMTATSVTFRDEQASDSERLRSTIAGEPYILAVLDVTSAWWGSWRNQHWTLRKDRAALTLRDYVRNQFAKEDKLSVAIGLICLAMSLTLLRPGLDDQSLQLFTDPKELTNIIMAAVDQIVLSNVEDAHESDLVLLLLLKGKIHAESNQVRKAWLHMQRATQIAQVLHLGIPKSLRSNDEDLQAEQQFLGAVLEAERFMSMVFGFPYSKDPNFSDVLAIKVLTSDSEDIVLRMRALRRVSAFAAQSINDRNQSNGSRKKDLASSVENTLDLAYHAMTLNWWDAQQHMDGENADAIFEVLMTQLWFWQVKSFLYIPDLLQSIAVNEPIENSRSSACLEAARHVVRIFTIVRSTPFLSIKVCNCDDFQGVLAGTILLIGIMQDVAHVEDVSMTPESDAGQFGQDMALIDGLKDIFRYRAYEQGGLIAKQGLNVLEALTAFFQEDETLASLDSKGLENKPTAIMLPYFGVIYVRPVKPLKLKETKADLQAISNFGLSHSGSSMINTAVSESCESGDAPSIDAPPLHDFDNMNQLEWDDWNQFVFDTELSRDWNPLNVVEDQYMSSVQHSTSG